MSVGTTKSERRRKTRKRPLTLVYVELAPGNGGMMRDLSEEGFAVRAMMPVRAGESTPFAFSLTEKIRIEGRGQIHWVQENGHVAGVRFLDLTAGTREQIREWLVRPEAPPKREAGASPKEMTLEELRKEIHSVPARPEGKPSVEEPVLPKTVVPEPAEVVEPEEMVAPAAVVAPAEAVMPAEVPAKTAAPEPEIVEAKEPEVVAASEPQPVAPLLAKEPEPEPQPVVPVVAAAAEPAVPVVVEKEPGPPPPAIPSAPVVEEVAPAAPDVTVAPVEATPVASAPSVAVAAPTKVIEPTVAPELEAKRETKFEEAEAPALPRLTLFPRVVDPEVEPAAPQAASQEMAPPKLHWKPIPLVEAQESETKARETQAPETQAALPDISSILMQPAGKAHAPRPTPPIPPVEALPSWDPESMARERWSERFSLTSAIALMSVVALLASLYVFHKEVGQGLIWLGEQLGGVPESSSPAAIPANNSAPRTQSEQPAAVQPDPSAQSQQTLQPTNTTADGAAEEQDTAAKSNAQPMTPLSGVAPPISSSPDTGQNEYTQALQLRRTKGAAAMQEILRLLWVSVEKGNASAELELAQMYWHGQGVIQNCDQAHILLTAAARKGSAEAQRRLVEFQRVGCE